MFFERFIQFPDRGAHLHKMTDIHLESSDLQTCFDSGMWILNERQLHCTLGDDAC